MTATCPCCGRQPYSCRPSTVARRERKRQLLERGPRARKPRLLPEEHMAARIVALGWRIRSLEVRVALAETGRD